MPPLLCAVPQEILEHIAYELTCLTPLGPPAALIPMLLTCKTVNICLSGGTALFARIFRFKFDDGAVKRRAFTPTPLQYFDQLVQYCRLLPKLRDQLQVDDYDDVLFGVYLMMLEDDGKNLSQLQHAGLESYLDLFVRTRMWDSTSHGWPVDNVANACALWLTWMTTTGTKLKEETLVRRNQIIRLVLPYVLVPYRYASAFAPQNHFVLPLRNTVAAASNSIVTAHGPYPVYLDPRRVWSQVHFSARPAIVPPLVSVAAKLVYFSRREAVPFDIPSGLPLTRAHAHAAGMTDIGPTQEDLLEFNAHLNRRLPEIRPGWGEDAIGEPLSSRWDSDWWRLRTCFDPWADIEAGLGRRYEPGTLTGLWQGRMIVPSESHFNGLITTPMYPASFDEGYLAAMTTPIFMRIQEHHSLAPAQPVRVGGVGDGWDDGLVNGYFPPKTRFKPRAHGVTVHIDGEVGEYEYVTHRRGDVTGRMHNAESCAECQEREETRRHIREARAGAAYEALFARVGLVLNEPPDPELLDADEREDDDSPAPHDPHKVADCNGIQDIIFTGATDERHGQAWNHFQFYGRLRPWDGMIGILRVGPDPRYGALFFYGFVVGGHNFVGNWRMAHQDVGVPAYEGAFAMSRRDD